MAANFLTLTYLAVLSMPVAGPPSGSGHTPTLNQLHMYDVSFTYQTMSYSNQFEVNLGHASHITIILVNMMW
jgi:hypothetical protein